MTTRGDALNERVWKLFERAGFRTEPNSHDKREYSVKLPGRKAPKPIDLRARLGNTTVYGENTTSPRPSGGFTRYVTSLKAIMDIEGTRVGLVVLPKHDTSSDDRSLAKGLGIQVWGEEELRYYEAVVDAIGEHAKHELLGCFGRKLREARPTHPVLALRFKQPFTETGSDIFVFTMTPGELLRTCRIYRRAQGDADAYQRMVVKSRLRKIRKFVSSAGALLPPNIIVYFGPKVSWEKISLPGGDVKDTPLNLYREHDCDPVVLRIPMSSGSLELIDGQHRLYGFVGTEPATLASFNLVVLGMANLTRSQRRETFVSINDNSRRMNANLVAFLKHTDDEAECQADTELMAIRIVVALNERDPFKKRIQLLDMRGKERITLKGFSGYDLRGLLGKRGLLHKHYPHESREYIGALRLYFGVLKTVFKKQWKEPDRYIIFTNRGVSALLKLLKSILKNSDGPLDKKMLLGYFGALRADRADKDWETANLKSAYVGSKGWKDFHDDLVKAIRRRFPGFRK